MQGGFIEVTGDKRETNTSLIFEKDGVVVAEFLWKNIQGYQQMVEI